jgi:hypothetical protein
MNNINITILNEQNEELTLNNFNIDLMEHQKRILFYIYNYEKNIIYKLDFLKKYNCDFISTYVIVNIFLSNNYFNFILKNIKKKLPVQKIICINDIVGSGKSYMALSVIKNTEADIYKNFNLNSYKNIIIVKFKLIKQWCEYLNRCNMLFICVNTNLKLKELVNSIEKYNIILLSYNFIKQYYETFNHLIYLRCFVDEYDNIATYSRNNIEYVNKILFQQSIFKYIISSTLNHKELLNKSTNVSLPISYIKNNSVLIINKLNLPQPIIKKYELKNKAFDIVLSLNNNDSDIIKQINADNYTNGNDIIYTIFNDLISEKNNLEKLTNDYQSESGTLILKKINNINTNINNIKDRILIDNCPICFERINNKILLLCCNNVCCKDCLLKITKCMMCRQEIKKTKFTSLTDSIKHKIDHIKNLTVEPNSKILILGDNKYHIKKDNLEEISYTLFNTNTLKILDGNTNTCNKAVDDFKNGNVNILYLKNYTSIVGFNFEFVTDLIILCTLSYNDLTQLIGRLQRIGRINSATIHIYDYEYKICH